MYGFLMRSLSAGTRYNVVCEGSDGTEVSFTGVYHGSKRKRFKRIYRFYDEETGEIMDVDKRNFTDLKAITTEHSDDNNEEETK